MKTITIILTLSIGLGISFIQNDSYKKEKAPVYLMKQFASDITHILSIQQSRDFKKLVEANQMKFQDTVSDSSRPFWTIHSIIENDSLIQYMDFGNLWSYGFEVQGTFHDFYEQSKLDSSSLARIKKVYYIDQKKELPPDIWLGKDDRMLVDYQQLKYSDFQKKYNYTDFEMEKLVFGINYEISAIKKMNSMISEFDNFSTSNEIQTKIEEVRKALKQMAANDSSLTDTSDFSPKTLYNFKKISSLNIHTFSPDENGIYQYDSVAIIDGYPTYFIFEEGRQSPFIIKMASYYPNPNLDSIWNSIYNKD